MRNDWDVISTLIESAGSPCRWQMFITLLCHEQDGQDLVHSSQATCIDLADVNCTRHNQLLEDYAVLAHFSCCNTYVQRLEGFTDGFVAEDVVGRRGLLYEPGLERCKLFHVVNSFWNGPHLPCISRSKNYGLRRKSTPDLHRPLVHFLCRTQSLHGR